MINEKNGPFIVLDEKRLSAKEGIEFCFESDDPWIAGRQLEITTWYPLFNKYSTLEPGVNFFFLYLLNVDAIPIASCEGHPGGFYFMYNACYKTALTLNNIGYFTHEIKDENYWCMRINEAGHNACHKQSQFTYEDRHEHLTMAASAWKIAYPLK